MNERAEILRLRAMLDAYREAFRAAFVAYLKAGHGQTGAEAHAEAERVMAENDRCIALELGERG